MGRVPAIACFGFFRHTALKNNALDERPVGQQAIISLQHVQFHREQREIFSDLTLEIPRGKITAIMGPSGTGKTTALRLIAGQLIPDAGKVIVDGQSIPELSRKELFACRKHLGMLFQNSALFTNLTVFENVAFPLREHTKLPEAVIRTLVLMKLEAVGLRGASELLPVELSGGMARRVALARAIVFDPTILLYDEPFTGLDPITMGVIVKLIRELNEAYDMTSVIVSHDVKETASIADYIYLIADGRVVGFGSPEEMLSHHDLRVRQFMQGLPDGPVPFHYPSRRAYDQELLS